MVYPYDRTFKEILTCWNYTIKSFVSLPQVLVSPKGWGYGKFCEFDGGRIEISEEFEKSLEKCDAVLVRDSVFPIDFEKSILPKIRLTIAKDKKIIFCRRNIKEYEIIKSTISSDKLIATEYYKSRHENILKKQIFDINTPVLFVCGMATNTFKLRTGLLLASAFRKKGYKVSCICSANEMEYLGENVWPAFLYKDYSDNQKILEINRFVKRIEEQDAPHLMIIIVPGEVMEISKKCVGNFGMLATKIAKAVIPDCIVLNTVMRKMDEEFYMNISEHIKGMLFKEVDYFNCVPLLLQWQKSNDEKEACFLEVDEEYISSELETETLENVVQIFNLENAEILAEKIIEKLA